MKMNSKIQKWIPLVILGLLVILVLYCTSHYLKKGSRTHGTFKDELQGEEQVLDEATDLVGDAGFMAVVTGIDQEEKQISLLHIENQSPCMLAYSGGTNIEDKYGKAITLYQISVGDIVNVEYQEKNQKITKLQISDQAWVYKGIVSMDIDTGKKRIKIADQTYQYTDQLLVFSNDEMIGIDDLEDIDIVTASGHDQTIDSIVVTRGHGYLSFTNYDDFMGGYVQVGYEGMYQVISDMRIITKEGTFPVELMHDGLIAKETVSIRRGQEYVLDLNAYHKEAVQSGSVTFDIRPLGAELYINNELTDYTQPISLDYGEYVVKVVLGGYETCTRRLIVDASSLVININLADANQTDSDNLTDDSDSDDANSDEHSDTSDESSDQIDNNTNSNSNQNTNSDSNTSTTDAKHTITVQSPEGAKVYWNGNYMGVAPVSFNKMTGAAVVSLVRSGYQSKNYNVSVADDNEDVVFKFPELAQISE